MSSSSPGRAQSEPTAHARLLASAATVATAESLTGGRLAAALTAQPGASGYFLGGVVSYATAVKMDLLGVPADLVSEHGVVSAACGRAMAEAVRSRLGATYGLSTTGVAGPDPQDGIPPGRVYVGCAGPSGTTVVELSLSGDRAAIQEAAVRGALDLLIDSLSGNVGGLG